MRRRMRFTTVWFITGIDGAARGWGELRLGFPHFSSCGGSEESLRGGIQAKGTESFRVLGHFLSHEGDSIEAGGPFHLRRHFGRGARAVPHSFPKALRLVSNKAL